MLAPEYGLYLAGLAGFSGWLVEHRFAFAWCTRFWQTWEWPSIMVFELSLLLRDLNILGIRKRVQFILGKPPLLLLHLLMRKIFLKKTNSAVSRGCLRSNLNIFKVCCWRRLRCLFIMAVHVYGWRASYSCGSVVLDKVLEISQNLKWSSVQSDIVWKS